MNRNHFQRGSQLKSELKSEHFTDVVTMKFTRHTNILVIYKLTLKITYSSKLKLMCSNDHDSLLRRSALA